ncbi:hypothetical protein ABB37_08044 [Leptomonas pyrrhocoris]|uniref:Uncharacterized protein n=1 Tax=Leptomonas pyrrhocoris TaxID=157538 RepID=A0A0M9FTN3_LEPPY|nr:hypothetical protein ABB37_08044 [Leptomonas pyrrhocoris]KPA75850.1 hypothetical protein ABB37_08044 [Leptomonas pyrrhocoris]|eukprot:XP_015654289.1 hypothetical protein ABB37_08044 [Leptomonas pyrrhocoris]
MRPEIPQCVDDLLHLLGADCFAHSLSKQQTSVSDVRKKSNGYSDAQGYRPDEPLLHVSIHLDAVNAEMGSVHDLRASFFQVELPERDQESSVLPDPNSGTQWCLTRPPMGHLASPEIVQILTSTVAGRPKCAGKRITVNGQP